jgi:glutamyl-tRNA synthetase
LSEIIAPLLHADAKSFTNAEEFVSRNATFFQTTLTRPSYTPANQITQIPISSLHTASAALTLVPQQHWNIATHKFNITSYDGASAVLEENPALADANADAEKTCTAADKTFKKELYHYLRWALSAGAPGPGIPETMVILGRDETLRRLSEARESTMKKGARSPVAERLVRDKAKNKGQAQDGDVDRSWMGSLAPRA